MGHSFFKAAHKYGLFVSWIIACIATIGSLAFSEIREVAPCTLCWYQRIAMFPLALILGIAAFRKEYLIIPYALPLSIIGMLIALFHLLLQEIPALSAVCTGGPACNAKSIDFSSLYAVIFSLISFLLINIILLSLYRHRPKFK